MGRLWSSTCEDCEYGGDDGPKTVGWEQPRTMYGHDPARDCHLPAGDPNRPRRLCVDHAADQREHWDEAWDAYNYDRI